MDNNKSWKQKSAALTLAVSMVIANPLALTGCNSSHDAGINTKNQSQNIEEDKDKDKEEQQSSSTTYHSSSPFIFTSSGSSNSKSSSINETPSGWHAWTTPNSNGGYSGVHAGSVSG